MGNETDISKDEKGEKYMPMSSYDHATLCLAYSRNLYHKYGEVSAIFRSGVLSKEMKYFAGLVYCHPNDADKEYIEDFEYDYCDL